MRDEKDQHVQSLWCLAVLSQREGHSWVSSLHISPTPVGTHGLHMSLCLFVPSPSKFCAPFCDYQHLPSRYVCDMGQYHAHLTDSGLGLEKPIWAVMGPCTGHNCVESLSSAQSSRSATPHM